MRKKEFIKEGIRWCTHQRQLGIDVINISLGMHEHWGNLAAACGLAYQIGIPVVASAGNEVSGAIFPASYNGTISVASVGIRGEKLRHTPCSNIWSTTDLSAPGEKVLTTKPGNQYCISTGTSLAAPHVTGVLALAISMIKRKGKKVDSGVLESVLKSSCSNKNIEFDSAECSRKYDPRKMLLTGRKTYRCTFGAGVIDAQKFLHKIHRKL